MRSILLLLALASIIGLGHLQDMPQPGVCGISSIQPQASTRIVNGEAAIPHSRPYQLLLVGFFPNGTAKHYCGASLVKPTHVLTAAHCVAGDTAENVRIYPGVHYFSADVLTMENGLAVRQIFMHESYAAQSLNNDVAVIRLQKAVDVDFEKVALICLPSLSSDACKPGDAVVGKNRVRLVSLHTLNRLLAAASGWGSTSGSPNRTSASRPTELQQVALQCIANSQADCKPLTYVLGLFEQKSKMCAYAPNKSVCKSNNSVDCRVTMNF